MAAVCKANCLRKDKVKANKPRVAAAIAKASLARSKAKICDQGKTAQGNSKEQGKEKSEQSQSEGKGNQPEPSKSDKDTGTELTAKTQGGAQEKLGRSRSEETPQGAPPAERFYKPGEEGKDGIKGAGYVTVQLPEELAADAKGEGNRK